jgi:hypothetical protein
METVKAQFVLNPKEDKEANGYAKAQASEVDEGKPPLLGHVPPSDFQIILKHGLNCLIVELLDCQDCCHDWSLTLIPF